MSVGFNIAPKWIVNQINQYSGCVTEHMTKHIQYTLTNHQVVTAQEVAKSVGITVCAARLRLKRSNDPKVIFAESNKTTDFNESATVFRLSNGLEATVRELRDLTGLRENTIRQRLKVSTDYEYVTRPLVFENLDAKIYVLQDGSRVTVSEIAKKRNCSPAAAYDYLEKRAVETERIRKKYQLNDGQRVSIEDVAERTGVSMSMAKKRLLKSRDPQFVLATPGTRHSKKYTLMDGSTVTAKEVSEVTGLSFEGAKDRLRKSTNRKVVFKPHFVKARQFVNRTRLIETLDGRLQVVTEKVRLGEAINHSTNLEVSSS